jgi:SulP family sulfate permease
MLNMNIRWTGRYEGYSWSGFRKDVISGAIVGIIAIPLGMAFAIASGVKPEYGLYTTVIAGILIALFGGSKYQIGGPTGAFIPILFAIVAGYGYGNLLIAGFMAGVMLLIMGLLKWGSFIKFIPRPVTIGFTSGIAVIIFTGQIASFLGLKDVERHEEFIANMKEIFIHLHTINGYSVTVALVSLICIVLTSKLFPKVPGAFVGLLVSTILAETLFPGKVATIGSAYGAIPSSLPKPSIPDVSLDQLLKLIQPAFVIAMLGGIESLLSAVVADGMTGSRHNSNRELIGQGIANMVAPLFGGIPATGAIARTATNIKNGAVSPVSAIAHGIVVLLVLIMFAPYASLIPLASMAPILMVVAWNMSERVHFWHLLKARTSDSLVLAITFLLTVLTDLTTSVAIGMALAGLLFIKQMSERLTVAKVLPDPQNKREKVMPHIVTEKHDCPQIRILTIEGSLFFGAAQMFEQSIMEAIHTKPRVLLLRMSRVPFMDTTGSSHLANVVKQFQKQGGIVLVSGMKEQPEEVLKRTGLYDLIGADRFFAHTGDAIRFAIANLDINTCLGCKHLVFRECGQLSQQHVLSG